MLRTLPTYLLIGSLLWLSGCGSNGIKLYPVTGKVTGGMSSLEGTRVLFTPVDAKGVPSSGVIGADGSYSLEAIDGRKGAAEGKFKVSFTVAPDAMKAAMTEMGKNPPKSSSGSGPGPGGGAKPAQSGAGMGPKANRPFPDSYSSPTTSPKEVEVKPENNVIDLAL